jgi:hypothetical protein
MFNIFNKLYTPEWFKIVKPYGIINRLITCFRLLLPVLAKINTKIFANRYKIQRKGYDIISFKASTVLDTKDLEVISGHPNTKYPYRVTGITSTYTSIGCGYTDNIAIQNKDYIIVDGVYWFRQDPSIYCYVYTEEGEIVYYTVAFCSDYTSLTTSYKAGTIIGNTPTENTAYDNVIMHGLYGADNSLSLLGKGIFTTDGLQGIAKRIWREKDYTFVVTDTGNFIAFHDKSGVTVNNKIIVNESVQHYFTVNIDDVDYPVSIGVNQINSYPSKLKDIYPTLKITDNAFKGTDLLDILKNQGCSFTEIPYINKYDVDNTLLNQSMHQGIKLMYLGVAPVITTFACASEAKESSTVQLPDTSFSNIKLDIKYIY